MTSMLRYREHVIGSCCYLNMVDGKSIEARSRIMMVNLHKMRLRTDSTHSSSSHSNNSGSSESAERLQKDLGPPTFNISCEGTSAASSSITPNPNIEEIEEDKSNSDINPSCNLNFKNER